MKLKHFFLLLAALTLLFPALPGCRASSPEPVTRPETDIQITALFEPVNAVAALQSRLANSLSLEDVYVSFDEKQGTVKVQFEHPHDMNTHQLMILYLAVLSTAENYLPYSEQVEMAMALNGKPFLVLGVEVEALRKFRDGKISRAEFGDTMIIINLGTQ